MRFGGGCLPGTELEGGGMPVYAFESTKSPIKRVHKGASSNPPGRCTK